MKTPALSPAGVKTVRYLCHHRRLVAYEEISRLLNMQSNHLGAPLGLIRRVCQYWGFPRIDAMVVSSETRIPSEGFNEDKIQITQEQHDQYIEAIWAFDLDRLGERLIATTRI